MEDCFKLLHFHLGSQITNIRHIKRALNEAARIYVDLVKQGAGLQVPRRGRRPGRGLRRLADQLRVERQLHPAGIRQRRGLPHPERLRRRRGAAPDDPLRERPGHRGLPQRAGVQRAGRLRPGRERRAPRPCRTTPSSRWSTCWTPTRTSRVRNVLETYHDAQQALDMAMNLFGGGYLPLGAAVPRGEPLLGDLPQDPAAACGRWNTCPRSWRGSTGC